MNTTQRIQQGWEQMKQLLDALPKAANGDPVLPPISEETRLHLMSALSQSSQQNSNNMTTAQDLKDAEMHQEATGLSNPNVSEGPIPPNPVQLTEGQEAIDVSFNVNQREDVRIIKQAFADAWDAVKAQVKIKMEGQVRLSAGIAGKVKRLEAIAKTQLELGAMAAVKAVTR